MQIGRIAIVLVLAGFALAMCGCGSGNNQPKREVLRSANPFTADLYFRISGPAGVVDYIAGRLETGALAQYGRGVFLPPPLRRHPRLKVCSITRTIGSADNPSLQAWRGKKARVDVYGDDKSFETIFCQMIPTVLAPGA